MNKDFQNRFDFTDGINKTCSTTFRCVGNGQLDFDEFVTMMTIHMKTANEMEKELQQSFKVFDVNGDGFINASELRQAMTTIGEKMTEKDINDIMKQWDSDGDGKIDYKGYFSHYAMCTVVCSYKGCASQTTFVLLYGTRDVHCSLYT